MFWTILGIAIPVCACAYFGALAVKNIAKLFNK